MFIEKLLNSVESIFLLERREVKRNILCKKKKRSYFFCKMIDLGFVKKLSIAKYFIGQKIAKDSLW